MSMNPNSILVGNCYRDRFGAVFEVKAMEKGYVTFSQYMNTDSGGASVSQQTLPIMKFVQDLEAQVPCPNR
jgi:hypothetical protein